jgi:hypothetical protein
MNKVHPIEYVKQRCEVGGKLTKVDIYRGHLNPANRNQHLEKVIEIRPNDNNEFKNVWDVFEQNEIGNFTAVFYPSKSIIHFSNKVEQLNGTETMNGYIPTEEQINAQVQRILEAERLKNRVAELEAEHENNNMWGQRFGTALNMIIERWVGGSGTTTMEAEPVLNGSENLNVTENALAVIVNAFGEEWVQKFAAKVQREPNIVPQIKNFFS